MKYLLFLLRHFFDLPVTIYWNFRLFPISTAVKMPVLFSRKIKFAQLHRGNIELPDSVRPFFIKVGTDGVQGVSDIRKSFIDLGNHAKVVFNGRANLSRGVSLRSVSGCIYFGKDFYSNCNLSLICAESISFGDNTLLGWNINVRDCDGHRMCVQGEKKASVKPVVIEDNVWIAAYVDILKGVTIKRGSVVAYRSCVLRPFYEENILIGGYPARKLNGGVVWEI